jgi:hypothetical protein
VQLLNFCCQRLWLHPGHDLSPVGAPIWLLLEAVMAILVRQASLRLVAADDTKRPTQQRAIIMRLIDRS